MFENNFTDKNQSDRIIRDWRQDFKSTFDEGALTKYGMGAYLDEEAEIDFVQYGEASKENWHLKEDLYIKVNEGNEKDEGDEENE